MEVRGWVGGGERVGRWEVRGRWEGWVGGRGEGQGW